MNCEVIRDLLPLYTDGLTSPKTNQLIEMHLQSCPECSAFLEDLRMPIEASLPEDSGERLIKALHKQKRRSRAITISICVLIPLVILLTWWIRMETRFETSFVGGGSADPAVILKEEPQVKITEDEIALSKNLFSLPAVIEVFNGLAPTNDPAEFTQLSPDLLAEVLEEFLPEDARVTDIILHYNLIVLDYHCSKTRIILTIGDSDNTGYVDVIQKTVSTPEENGEVKCVYTSTYDVAAKVCTYEKGSSYHKWFGFLETGEASS